MESLNLAILISGRGSNMQALINACAADDFPAHVSVVLSNNPDAQGLEVARTWNIATEIVDHHHKEKKIFEAQIQDALSKYPVDLICLAGFMRILSADFIERWSDRIINIHPSLLPAYKGLNTHERVLADGVAESGCSVHFVTPGMDEGPVIVQNKVGVYSDDTIASLSARILEQEHKAYPQAVRLIAEGCVRIVDGDVKIR